MSVSQIINVIVNSKGAVTVQKQLNAIGDSAKTTTTYLNSLRAIFASALAFSGASVITDVANQFQNLQNKLKIVADGTNSVADSWNRLMTIANSSYATIDSTVDLYFRVAQAYKAWGESAEKAYQFTDLFQKAAILSGSSVQTTTQAVYQFGQALNKGKLDGDEFRSVLEGLPYVANIIQKSLGVTRTELYKMSAQGKISIDLVKAAFEEAADTIKGDFSKITPTIGMAINVLKNNWVDFVGEIQNSTGIFSSIAQVILLVANHFNLLAAALAPVAVSLAFLGGRAAIGLVIVGFRDLTETLKLATAAQWAFNVAMDANPIVIAVTAIAAVVAGVVYFRNELGLTNEVIATLWSYVTQFFTYLLTAFAPITVALTAIVNLFTGLQTLFTSIGALASTTGALIVAMFSSVGTSVRSLATYLATALGPVFSDLMGLAKSFLDLVAAIVDLFVTAWTPALQEISRGFTAFWTYARPALGDFADLVKQIYEGWVLIGSYVKSNFWPIIKDVFEGWITILRTVIGFIRDIISALISAINYAKTLMSMGFGGGGTSVRGAHNGAQFYAGEFAAGGSFKVGGTNSGRDQTPVAFRAERGERVTVETKKQQRANDNGQQEVNVSVNPQIVNVLDPDVVLGTISSYAGARSIINVMKLNRGEVKQILGVA